MKATFTPSNGTNGLAKTFEASYFAIAAPATFGLVGSGAMFEPYARRHALCSCIS